MLIMIENFLTFLIINNVISFTMDDKVIISVHFTSINNLLDVEWAYMPTLIFDFRIENKPTNPSWCSSLLQTIELGYTSPSINFSDRKIFKMLYENLGDFDLI